MALNTKQTKILARVKGKSARTFSRTKKAEPSAGGRLPPGINNGVAVFTGYILDEQNGKPFVKLQGKVLAPTEYDGLPLKGKNATIRHDLCDMKNKEGEVWRTYEQAEAEFLGDLQLLGIVTKELNTIDEVFPLLDELAEEKPQFVFHTWASKSGFVNTQLDGLFTGELEEDDEVYEEEDGDDTEVDNDDGGEVSEEEEYEEEEDDNEYISEEDEIEDADKSLVVLGTNADEGDDEAITTLTEKAGEYDIDPDDYETWLGLAMDLESFDEARQEDDEEGEEGEEDEDGDDAEVEGEEGEEAEDEDADEGYIPEKGDVFGFTPKGSRKSHECEVTAVFSQKETVNLKTLDNGKLYKNVPWDKLSILDE